MNSSNVLGIIIFGICATLIIILLFLMLNTETPKSMTQTELKELNLQLNNLSCWDLKLISEETKQFDFKTNNFKTIPLHASKIYDLKGCFKEHGYLKNSEDHLSIVGYRASWGMGKNFPIINNEQFFPTNWFYINSQTNKTYLDPQQYLNDLNKGITGKKNPNLIPMSCFSGFSGAKIQFNIPMCNYNMTVNGVTSVKNDPEGILHFPQQQYFLEIELDKLPNFKEMRCYEITNHKYSHECKYFESDYTFMVKKHGVGYD